MLNSANGFREGVLKSIPMCFGFIIFSFSFALFALGKGISSTHAILMSALMFAGAAQMASVNILAQDPINFLLLSAVCIIICSRFSLMSMTLHKYFCHLPRIHVYLSLFLLIDENWALTLLQAKDSQHDNNYLFSFFLGSSFALYAGWVLGTVISLLAMKYIGYPKQKGIDFVFVIIFYIIALSMWRGKKDILPWFVAALTAIITHYFFKNGIHIVIGALTGSLVGVFSREQN